MIAPARACLLLIAAVLLPTDLLAGPLQRYTLIVGANFGGDDRPLLRYAVSDAERFARVLVDIGGVNRTNEIVLKDPKVREFMEALSALGRRVAEGHRATAQAGGRTEVVFYYSGHADEKGLLLGEDRISYQTLRDRLDEIPADVRIAVLDACASGAFTRIKGGKIRPPFMVNPAAHMRGHAFLTSSAATEAAQESDRIKASYFTHYLVSGFRGAADTSGDGQVTLSEAYQFAFTETLGRTVDTRGGAQHPSYEINLTGAGDVVMTDVRQTSATLVLDEELAGRFFVRQSSSQVLVAELYKARGRKVELALEPGSYDVRIEFGRAASSARAQLTEGAPLSLAARQFGTATVEPTRSRGEDAPGRFAVVGRSRMEMVFGGWGSNGRVLKSVFGASMDMVSGAQYTKYVREDLAVTLGMLAYGAETNRGILGGFATPFGVRWNPRRGALPTQRLKPFLGVAVLPVTRIEAQRYGFGMHLGAGADLHLTETLTIGVKAGYNGFPIGVDADDTRHPYDGFGGRELSFSIGRLFGSPYRSRP
jgi:hypothetical protein